MHNVVISGTGLYTPAQSISNEELVESFNTWSQQFNRDNAAAIERGEIEAAPLSDVASSKRHRASRAASSWTRPASSIRSA